MTALPPINNQNNISNTSALPNTTYPVITPFFRPIAPFDPISNLILTRPFQIISGTDQDDIIEISLGEYTSTSWGMEPPRPSAYRGGKGNDTAVFKGNLSNYSIEPMSDGSINISTPYSGENINLSDFETFKFADITLSADQLKDTSTILNYFRNTWNQLGLTDYTIEISKTRADSRPLAGGVRFPMIDPTTLGKNSITLDIINDQVLQSSDQGYDIANSPLAHFKVDNIFNLIDQANQRGDTVKVIYSELGVPRTVDINNERYNFIVRSKIITGTNQDDTLLALPTSLKKDTSSYSLSTNYRGGEGDDTLIIPANLEDFHITQMPNGNFSIVSKASGFFTTHSSNIEHFKFNDIILDTDQFNKQLLGYYKARWDKNPPQDYSLHITRSLTPIFREPNDIASIIPYVDRHKDVTIEFKNGQPISATSTNLNSTPVMSDSDLAQFTPEKIFDLINTGITNNQRMDITYGENHLPYIIKIFNGNERTIYEISLRPSGLDLNLITPPSNNPRNPFRSEDILGLLVNTIKQHLTNIT